MTITEIAKICHEANREYCQTLGDDSQLSWNMAPDWQKESVIAGVQLAHSDPTITPITSHNSWARYKEADGWTFGPVKDTEAKQHPNMVSWDELPENQKIKDILFLAIVRALEPNIFPSNDQNDNPKEETIS